jgi:RNA polymerase sigma-70 factor (ECF subfamily)
MAFLLILERLSPVQRAVLLLREVFGYGYPEIAGIVGRSEDNCCSSRCRPAATWPPGGPRFEVPGAAAMSWPAGSSPSVMATSTAWPSC